MDKVTKTQAEEILQQVRERFAAYIDGETTGPTLIMDFDYFGDGYGTPTIVWEEGPFEWAIVASLGGIDEEMASLVREAAKEFGLPAQTPKPVEPVGSGTVWTEATTSWALGLFRR